MDASQWSQVFDPQSHQGIVAVPGIGDNLIYLGT